MDYTLLSDAELISFLRNSDAKAYKEIYVRYWKEMFMVAYRKTGSRELAEEIIQNVFLDLWRKHPTLEIRELSNYLFSSVRFSVINHIKSQMVQERYISYKKRESEETAAASDQLLLMHDLAEAINKGIALLPKKTQEVFKLSRIENRSVSEIARRMQISEKAVEYHITQSLKKMRCYLKDYILLLLLYLFS